MLSILAALLTWRISPILRNTFFEFFYMAVVISAFYGGLGPGILAATTSFFIIDYFFLPPVNHFVMGPDLLRLIIFEAAAVLISFFSGELKRSQHEIAKAHNELEIRIADRTEDLQTANQRLIREVAQRREAEQAILDISSREHRRLGQDLHDGVCQTLAGIRLVVEDMKEHHSDAETGRSADLEKIESGLTQALAQADAVSRGLYPVELEKNGLMSALEELADKISNLYEVECRFRCWEPILIQDGAVANHLYRIAQESVINAIKGGKAKRIHLSLLRQKQRVLLRIADNGIGLQNSSKRNGMGIQIMKYRARVISAELQFRSRANGSTVVSCTLFDGGG